MLPVRPNIPDTVGYMTPSRFGDLIRELKRPQRRQSNYFRTRSQWLRLSSNFLEAAKMARQVGMHHQRHWRTGWKRLTGKLVMALHVQRQYFNPYLGRAAESEEPLTNIDTRQIYKTSRLVSNLTGMLVQPNKAVVGANALPMNQVFTRMAWRTNSHMKSWMPVDWVDR